MYGCDFPGARGFLRIFLRVCVAYERVFGGSRVAWVGLGVYRVSLLIHFPMVCSNNFLERQRKFCLTNRVEAG